MWLTIRRANADYQHRHTLATRAYHMYIYCTTIDKNSYLLLDYPPQTVGTARTPESVPDVQRVVQALVASPSSPIMEG